MPVTTEEKYSRYRKVSNLFLEALRTRPSGFGLAGVDGQYGWLVAVGSDSRNKLCRAKIDVVLDTLRWARRERAELRSS